MTANKVLDKKIVLGLTGGIATGKSFVANEFAAFGATIVSADVIAKQISEDGGAAYEMLLKEFSEFFIESVGADVPIRPQLNRKLLQKHIFENSKAKTKLEKNLHPLIKQEIQNQIFRIKSGLIILEVPLLFESRFNSLCDKTAATVCDKDIQLNRLIARDSIDKKLAEKIINTQSDPQVIAKKACYIIDTTANITEQLEALIQSL